MSEYTELSKEAIDYPLHILNQLIDGNSPYAFYIFQWVPYHKDARTWRLKMLHDIKLKDGTVVEGVYPNADRWDAKYHDNDVAEIRISREQYGYKYQDPRD